MGAMVNTCAFPKGMQHIYSPTVMERARPINIYNGNKAHKIYVLDSPAPGETKFTILYSHANGETLETSIILSDYYSEMLNVNIIIYDWEGYGMSDGSASEVSLKRGAVAAFEYARKQYPNTTFISWGRSIGTVAASYIASIFNQLVKAVILQSPMASAFNVVFKHPCCGCADQLKNEYYVRDLNCYIAIIHGENDNIVPIRNSDKIYNSYRKRISKELGKKKEAENIEMDINKQVKMRQCKKLMYYIIKNGGHNNLDNMYFKQIVAIIQNIMKQCHQDVGYHVDDNIFATTQVMNESQNIE